MFAECGCQVDRERRLAAATFCGKHRDGPGPRMPAGGRATTVHLSQSVRESDGAPYCGVEAREIAFLHDLTKASTERVGEQCAVHAAANQYNAESGAVESHPLREPQRRAQVDRCADD